MSSNTETASSYPVFRSVCGLKPTRLVLRRRRRLYEARSRYCDPKGVAATSIHTLCYFEIRGKTNGHNPPRINCLSDAEEKRRNQTPETACEYLHGAGPENGLIEGWVLNKIRKHESPEPSRPGYRCHFPFQSQLRPRD